MPVSKVEKRNEARKNAEALMAKKKVTRTPKLSASTAGTAKKKASAKRR